MEDTIILNTNEMLPNYDEFTELRKNEERSKILNITNKLDKLLNTKKILASYYNYQTDNAEELDRFTEMFEVESVYFANKIIKVPSINNEIHKLFITNIYWSNDGLTIKGNDLTSSQARKISINKIQTEANNYEFYCLENGILKPINITLYPDVYELYLSFEEHLNIINQLITTYQKCFNTLEGLAFLKDEVPKFIEYCSTGYPIDNLFAICFKNISEKATLENKDVKEYLNYIINAYVNYLFLFDEVRTWKKYLLDGYIQDENGQWKYHDLHYSKINKLTYNHYVPISNEFSRNELDKECMEIIDKKDYDCTYSLSKIRRSNLIK